MQQTVPLFLGSAILVLAGALLGCAREPVEPAPASALTTPTPPPPARPRVPAEGFLTSDPDTIARDRLDPSWRPAAERDLAVRRGRQPPSPQPAALPAKPSSGNADPSPPLVDRFASAGTATPTPAGPGADAGAGRDRESPATPGSPADSSPPAESFAAIGPDAFGGPPRLPVGGGAAAGPTVLRIQRLLDRVGFSPGVLDGHWGKNSEKAVFWLQATLGLEPTGTIGEELYRRLVDIVGDRPLRSYTVSAEDLAGPFVEVPEEPAAQAALDCLCHASPVELLAERFHTSAELLAQLNPGVELERLAAGTRLTVPDVEVVRENRQPLERIARLVISKDGGYLHAEDDGGTVLYHFPITLGSAYDPSPSGELRVVGIAYDPDFHYQPKLFAEVPDDDPEHLLPPGPNSPVGTVWIELSKESYGIHGTAAPETIGYASSHGCIRLTNWDAVFLANRLRSGVPVQFVD